MVESFPYSCAPDTRDTVRGWAREHGVILLWNDWTGYTYETTDLSMTVSGYDPQFRFLHPTDEVRHVEALLGVIRHRETPAFRYSAFYSYPTFNSAFTMGTGIVSSGS